LDREVIYQSYIAFVTDAVDANLLHVGTPVPRRRVPTPDVRSRECAGRDRRAVEVERLVTVEAELEQRSDEQVLLGRVADLEDDVPDVEIARQRDRLRVRREVDTLLAVRLGERHDLLV